MCTARTSRFRGVSLLTLFCFVSFRFHFIRATSTEILSSKKYTAKQKQYRLFAVVYHDGKEASKGHYITDVYHTGYLNWIRYDDSTIKRVSEKSVLNPLAHRVPYLLYYRRCDTLQQPTNTNASTSTSNTYNK